jgi:hypothetical protein
LKFEADFGKTFACRQKVHFMEGLAKRHGRFMPDRLVPGFGLGILLVIDPVFIHR